MVCRVGRGRVRRSLVSGKPTLMTAKQPNIRQWGNRLRWDDHGSQTSSMHACAHLSAPRVLGLDRSPEHGVAQKLPTRQAKLLTYANPRWVVRRRTLSLIITAVPLSYPPSLPLPLSPSLPFPFHSICHPSLSFRAVQGIDGARCPQPSIQQSGS